MSLIRIVPILTITLLATGMATAGATEASTRQILESPQVAENTEESRERRDKKDRLRREPSSDTHEHGLGETWREGRMLRTHD